MSTNPYIATDAARVPALEQQLIMCKLTGKSTKAMMIRGSLRAIKIRHQVEYAKEKCNGSQ